MLRQEQLAGRQARLAEESVPLDKQLDCPWSSGLYDNITPGRRCWPTPAQQLLAVRALAHEAAF